MECDVDVVSYLFQLPQLSPHEAKGNKMPQHSFALCFFSPSLPFGVELKVNKHTKINSLPLDQ